MASVTLTGVTKVYPGGVWAVKGLSLAIQDGEFAVLVGPSGCGKTTTLRMVAGLEANTSGTVAIGDRVVDHLSPKDRDVAMVFQSYSLYPHLSVYGNLAFGLRLRRRELRLGRGEMDQRIRRTAELLGIGDLLERMPSALSGGQRQRVALGRAMVRNPAVLLFDEPLSNLDAKLRVELRAEIKRHQRRLGATTLYVTHDQEEAMSLGDRVVVLKDGVVQQCASPLEVYEAPANRFVAGFIGTPPMSFLNGRVRVSNGGWAFDEGRFRIPLEPRLTRRLGGSDGRPLVLGIRPEALGLRPWTREGPEVRLEGRVSLVEPLGDRQEVHMTTGSGQRLVARVEPHAAVREGQELAMYVDVSRVHLFEPGEAGANLSADWNGSGARVE
jgi:multiple sugar transport system ATP-binding protein